MQYLGKILVNIVRTGSFICLIGRGLMGGVWEELSQAVRITVSGKLEKQGSSVLQVYLTMLDHFQLAAYPVTTASLTFWDSL